MRSKIIRIVVWGAVAIAVVVVVYLRYTRMRVDRLIGEANDMIDEGEAKQKELGLEGNQLLSGSLTKDFLVASAAKTDPKETDVFTDTASGPVIDQEKLAKAVARTDAILAQIVEIYRGVAAKFDEGRKANKSEVVSNYLQLMSDGYQKRAEAEETRRKALAVLVDKTIKSEKDRRKKFGDLINEARTSDGNFEILEEQASKLRDDNKSQFK